MLEGWHWRRWHFRARRAAEPVQSVLQGWHWRRISLRPRRQAHQLQEVPQGLVLVLHCGPGMRAGSSADMLVSVRRVSLPRDEGWEAFFLGGTGPSRQSRFREKTSATALGRCCCRKCSKAGTGGVALCEHGRERAHCQACWKAGGGGWHLLRAGRGGCSCNTCLKAGSGGGT